MSTPAAMSTQVIARFAPPVSAPRAVMTRMDGVPTQDKMFLKSAMKDLQAHAKECVREADLMMRACDQSLSAMRREQMLDIATQWLQLAQDFTDLAPAQ